VKQKLQQPGASDDLAKAEKYKYDPEDWEPKPNSLPKD
jgi:hypothetical protein